jgi:hypothetical protein
LPKKLHMLSGAIYEAQEEGVVLVTNPDGRSGRFDGEGCWIDGELRESDPHLCLWVGGKQLPASHAVNTKDLPLALESKQSQIEEEPGK